MIKIAKLLLVSASLVGATVSQQANAMDIAAMMRGAMPTTLSVEQLNNMNNGTGTPVTQMNNELTIFQPALSAAQVASLGAGPFFLAQTTISSSFSSSFSSSSSSVTMKNGRVVSSHQSNVPPVVNQVSNTSITWTLSSFSGARIDVTSLIKKK